MLVQLGVRVIFIMLGGQPDCEESYGSYDVATGTLTLGAGVNGKSVHIVDISEPGNSYTIKASADISAGLSTPGYATVTFDLENHSWTQPTEDPKFFTMPTYGTTIVKSGTINMVDMFSNNNLTITGGSVNMSGNSAVATGGVSAGVFTMNGGSLNIENGDLEIKTNAEINGGEIDIKNKYGFGGCIYLSTAEGAEFNLNGGIVTVDAEGSSRSGIEGSSNNVVTINGGKLNINNSAYGVHLNGKNSKINFNGGTTTIKNSSRYAVDLRYVNDPENAIGFKDGIGIVEPNLYVFWEDDKNGTTNWTGIVAEDTLTIAEGGKVRRHYGWDIGDGDSDDNEESDLKVPDTGIFSSENSSAMIVAISMGALAALTGGAYAISYIVKRYGARAKFLKK